MPTQTRIRNILVPTDFSEPALEAWRYAQAFARHSNARLHLLHVIGDPYLYGEWGTEGAAVRMDQLLVEARSASERGLAAWVARSGRSARRIATATAMGPIVTRILDYAVQNRIDLIVIGTHGRGLVGHFLLGSVAERVVQRSPVPVLTVHGKSGPARDTRRPRARASRRRRSRAV
jgi:nucleotide-binding universal stress UspA family protein